MTPSVGGSSATPPADGPSLRKTTLGVLAFALAVRLVVLLEFSTIPFFTHHRGDARLYHDAALRFAGGDLLLGDQVLHMSPLYSVFLGVQYRVFGSGPWAPRLIQVALGVAVVWMVFDVVRRLLGARWAAGAGLFTAMYGPLVYHDLHIHVASLSIACNAAVLWGCVRLATEPSPSRRGSLRMGAALGLAWGLAILARPNALLLGFAVVPACAGAWTRETAWRDALRIAVPRFALVATVGALTVLPVTVRNVVVAGAWVPVTDSGGLNFYLGNGPGAIGTFRIPGDVPGATRAQRQFDAFHEEAERREGRTLAATEVDAFWYAKTREHIAAQPGQFVRILARKARLFWNGPELSNTHSFGFHRELLSGLWLAPFTFGWIAGLALLGVALELVAVLRRRGHAGRAAVAGFVVAGFIALVMFFVLGHYRATFVPGVIVAAALGAERIGGWIRSWSPTRLLGVAVAATVTVAAWVPVLEIPRSYEWRKLGFAYHRAGDLPAAERAYRRAIEIDPDNASAHKNLAILREQLGDLEGAVEGWHQVRRVGQARGDQRLAGEAWQALQRLGAR